jgi:hypothetical protein
VTRAYGDSGHEKYVGGGYTCHSPPLQGQEKQMLYPEEQAALELRKMSMGVIWSPFPWKWLGRQLLQADITYGICAWRWDLSCTSHTTKGIRNCTGLNPELNPAQGCARSTGLAHVSAAAVSCDV